MNRITKYLLALLLPLLASCSTITETPGRYEAPANVSEKNYEAFHRSLYTSDGNSRGFTADGNPRFPAHQHDLARDYIFSTFESMGYTTHLDPFHFTYFGIVYTNCNNIVAVKPGSNSDKIHIVGAHYDTIDGGHTSANLCPGADDNASGVAAILEAARVIQHHTFDDTIIFIAFDGEEKGIFGNGHPGSPGAHHFVTQSISTDASDGRTYLRDNIESMISLDTIGYVDTNAAQKVIIGRKGIMMQKAGADFSRAVTTYTELIPSRIYGYGVSDHAPFDNVGIESLHIAEAHFKDFWPLLGKSFKANPYYHSDQDSVDRPGYINYEYATAITRALVGYLCEQARLVQ